MGINSAQNIKKGIFIMDVLNDLINLIDDSKIDSYYELQSSNSDSYSEKSTKIFDELVRITAGTLANVTLRNGFRVRPSDTSTYYIVGAYVSTVEEPGEKIAIFLDRGNTCTPSQFEKLGIFDEENKDIKKLISKLNEK
ncbi:hypothetical protein ACYSNN_07410, partial [Peptoniphilus genitalis]